MNLLYEKESFEIRGACFWIWKEFGSAFKESIIDNALTEELVKRGLKVENQKRINIYYNGKKVGVYIPDKVINDAIIIEVKSKPNLTNQDIKQFWHYLKGTEYKLGFLINFGEQLEIKRVVYDAVRIREEISVVDPRGDQRKGFTLMEIVVATTIFAIVFSALLSLFNYTLKINRKTEALRQASQGMRDFVEYLVKEVRNGQLDYYVLNGLDIVPKFSTDSPCAPPPGGLGTDTYVSKENRLGIINADGVQECFYLGDDTAPIPAWVGAGIFSAPAGHVYNLMMAKAGISAPQTLNPPNYRVENLMFLIRPIKDPYTATGGLVKVSPAVSIFIKFVTQLPTGEQVPIYYQTSVSTSQYDIPSN